MIEEAGEYRSSPLEKPEDQGSRIASKMRRRRGYAVERRQTERKY
jgi:hypothetical protein